MSDAFTANDLLGLSHLFKLAANNPQSVPGSVFVLVPVEDCGRLSRLLLAESVRRREANEQPESEA